MGEREKDDLFVFLPCYPGAKIVRERERERERERDFGRSFFLP